MNNWQSLKTRGPYKSMSLENPRKNWKEEKINLGLFITDVKQFLQKMVRHAMVHFLNNIRNLTSSSLKLLIAPKI
jgi:hypothetical protein